MKDPTAESPMTSSSPFSLRKIAVLWAQGHAQATYRWYRLGSAGKPLPPSAEIRSRKLVSDLTNLPSVFFHCLSVFHSPFTSIPGILSPEYRFQVTGLRLQVLYCTGRDTAR